MECNGRRLETTGGKFIYGSEGCIELAADHLFGGKGKVDKVK
jgi:hypothetical protein